MIKKIALLGSVLSLLTTLIVGQEYITEKEIEEVIVTENRIQVPLNKKPAAIQVISAAQIKSAPVNSVAELLSYYSGVDIRQRGTNGVQADPGIRGSSFDQVLVLINGIRVSDPQTGHHSFNLPLDLEAVEQIEIYKGPSARVFGQNAFAGAINIVTKVPDGKFVRVSAGGGDFGFAEMGTGIALSGKTVKNYLSANRVTSDGYRYNTDFIINNLFVNSMVTTGAGEIGLIAGVTDRSFGANGFYASPDYRDQFESVRTSLLAADFKPSFNDHRIKATGRLFWRNNEDDYIFIRSDPSYYHNTHTTNSAGADINISIYSSLGITGIGVDVGADMINSNRLGERKRFYGTLFAEQRFSFYDNSLMITPGMQVNIYSDYEDNILPGIDAGYQVTRNMMIFAGSGYTFRVPTYTDLYYVDPLNSSNPQLQPEYSFSNELGIKSTGKGILSYQGSLFHRRGTNLIDRTKNSEAEKWVPLNVSEVITKGLDISLVLSPRYNDREKGLVRRVEAGYTYIDSRLGDRTPFYSKLSLENLRNQITAGLELRYPYNISHFIHFRYSDRVNLEDFSVIDTRLSWSNRKLEVFVEATNIMNAVYRETNLVTLPGRWFKTGIQWKIFLN